MTLITCSCKINSEPLSPMPKGSVQNGYSNLSQMCQNHFKVTNSKTSFRNDNKKKTYFFHLSLSVVCGNSKLGCSHRYMEQSTFMVNNVFYTEKGPQATHMLETPFCSGNIILLWKHHFAHRAIPPSQVLLLELTAAQEVMAEKSERGEPTSY